MSGTGTNVTHIGFANWNTGNNQDFLFDSLEVRGSSAIGGGITPIAVNNSLTGLSANTMYHYRTAAMNLDGGTSYGVNTAFFTGTDLSIASSVTEPPWIRGTNGEIQLTINNTGSTASSGTLTVSVSLPVGLTVTGISGTGWTASSSGLSCTRSDSLGVGLNYPVITLNVAVASNAAELCSPRSRFPGQGMRTLPTILSPTPLRRSPRWMAGDPSTSGRPQTVGRQRIRVLIPGMELPI